MKSPELKVSGFLFIFTFVQLHYMKFRITQNLSNFDKYRFSVYIILRSRRMKRILAILLLPFLITSTLSLILFFGFNSTTQLQDWWMTLIFPSIVALVIFVLPYVIIKLKKMETPVYEFDDWQMTVITKAKNIKISWGDIAYYKDFKNHILLMHGAYELVAHIIPKKEFQTLEELNEFEQLLIGTGLKKKR